MPTIGGVGESIHYRFIISKSTLHIVVVPRTIRRTKSVLTTIKPRAGRKRNTMQQNIVSAVIFQVTTVNVKRRQRHARPGKGIPGYKTTSKKYDTTVSFHFQNIN